MIEIYSCHCKLTQLSPEQIMLKSYDVLIYIFTLIETYGELVIKDGIIFLQEGGG